MDKRSPPVFLEELLLAVPSFDPTSDSLIFAGIYRLYCIRFTYPWLRWGLHLRTSGCPYSVCEPIAAWFRRVEKGSPLPAILAREARIDSMVSQSILPALVLWEHLSTDLMVTIVALAYWFP